MNFNYNVLNLDAGKMLITGGCCGALVWWLEFKLTERACEDLETGGIFVAMMSLGTSVSIGMANYS